MSKAKSFIDDLLQESNTRRSKKVNFSKFLPDDNGFIKLQGGYDPKDPQSCDVELVIQAGLRNTLTLWTWGTADKSTRKTLEAIHEATAKALKFLDEATESQKNVSKDIKAKRVTKTKA